jgi:hypothetical protein
MKCLDHECCSAASWAGELTRRDQHSLSPTTTTRPRLADLIEGVAGQWSPFEQQHGFSIDGVGWATAVLPDGWRDRLVRVQNANTPAPAGAPQYTGRCLDKEDLCAAKLCTFGETNGHRCRYHGHPVQRITEAEAPAAGRSGRFYKVGWLGDEGRLVQPLNPFSWNAIAGTQSQA